jgi:hypothetical protein
VKVLLWFLGTVVLPVLLSECTDLSPWLAKRLVRRAARRIPKQERPRWEEEWLNELASKPGRLVQLLWALWHLPLVWGAGEMGRLLGVPPISQLVRARLRAAWQSLRLRRRVPAQEPDPEPIRVQRMVSLSAVLAADALVADARVTVGNPRVTVRPSRPPTGMPYLCHEEFIEWLFYQRQEFEHHLDHYHSARSEPWCPRTAITQYGGKGPGSNPFATFLWRDSELRFQGNPTGHSTDIS